jgi:hypothetical protein
MDERTAALETKLQQLKIRQQRGEARARALIERRDRKAETRRKVLVGALVLAKIEQGAFDETTLIGWLDKTLSREDDRALFDLPPREASRD